MRATFDPFPRSWKRGHLILNKDGVRWAPGVRLRTAGTPLPSPIRVGKAREVQGPEKMHVKGRFFQVVEGTTVDGELLFGVPRDSVDLVIERFTAD